MSFPPALLCAGLSRKYPLFQRIAVMQLVKQLLADPFLMYYLFQSYDLQQENTLGVVQAMIACASEVVEATLNAVNKDPEDEPPVEVVSALYAARTAGEGRDQWSECWACPEFCLPARALLSAPARLLLVVQVAGPRLTC